MIICKRATTLITKRMSQIVGKIPLTNTLQSVFYNNMRLLTFHSVKYSLQY